MTDSNDFERWVVLLAGGIGSRFWPASTPLRPKQFLPLASDRSLIEDTFERAHALAPTSQILIVSGESQHALLTSRLTGFPGEQLLLEPVGRSTAPALAWAARIILNRVRDEERAVMVSLHSDHYVHPVEEFASTMDRAIRAAGRTGRLLTIGIRPTRADTGYGYIERGNELDDGVFSVQRFVEKPDRETATRYVEAGDFLWNSGMFVWRPDVLLDELRAHTPELSGELERLEDGDVAGFFENVPNLSIDRGLMERTSNIAVMEADFEWDDVGSWQALVRTKETDASGDVIVGDAHALECSDSVIWAEPGPVVVFGMNDIVVAQASGITFVAPLDRAQDLKQLLSRLPTELQKGRA